MVTRHSNLLTGVYTIKSAGTTKLLSQLTSTLAKAKPLVDPRRHIRPAVSPRASLVQEAATRSAPGPAVKTLNYVANVPKGERFAQRPLGNTGRLLSLDGLPGMRRVGQLATAATVLGGGKLLYDTNRDIDQQLKATAIGASRLAGDRNIDRTLYNQLNGAKWDLIRDQTLGATGRMLGSAARTIGTTAVNDARAMRGLLTGQPQTPFEGLSPSTRDQKALAQDKLIRGLALSSMGEASKGYLGQAWQNRTPVTALTNQILSRAARQPLALDGQEIKPLASSDTTNLERVLRERAGNLAGVLSESPNGRWIKDQVSSMRNLPTEADLAVPRDVPVMPELPRESYEPPTVGQVAASLQNPFDKREARYRTWLQTRQQVKR